MPAARMRGPPTPGPPTVPTAKTAGAATAVWFAGRFFSVIYVSVGGDSFAIVSIVGIILRGAQSILGHTVGGFDDP